MYFSKAKMYDRDGNGASKSHALTSGSPYSLFITESYYFVNFTFSVRRFRVPPRISSRNLASAHAQVKERCIKLKPKPSLYSIQQHNISHEAVHLCRSIAPDTRYVQIQGVQMLNLINDVRCVGLIYPTVYTWRRQNPVSEMSCSNKRPDDE
jgi:hypothetical protein